VDFVGKREFFEGDCYFPGERRIGLVKVEDPEGFDGEDNMAYYEIERRAELLSSSTNPFRNSHFRSSHSSHHCETYITRCAFHSNGCIDGFIY
jgi:hypothetical protein